MDFDTKQMIQQKEAEILGKSFAMRFHAMPAMVSRDMWGGSLREGSKMTNYQLDQLSLSQLGRTCQVTRITVHLICTAMGLKVTLSSLLGSKFFLSSCNLQLPNSPFSDSLRAEESSHHEDSTLENPGHIQS